MVEIAKIINFNLGEKLSKRGNFKCFHHIPCQKTHNITEGIFLTCNFHARSQYSRNSANIVFLVWNSLWKSMEYEW